MLQEYTSRFYQPVTPSTYQNICMVQPFLVISDSLFSSSEILTLEGLPPLSGTSMNIKNLDYLIFSIPYISQVISIPPISDQFPINTHRNIYVLSIDNEDPSLASTDVQLLQDKQKCTIYFSVTITLDPIYTSALTSLEEHLSLFDQVRPPIRVYHPPS